MYPWCFIAFSATACNLEVKFSYLFNASVYVLCPKCNLLVFDILLQNKHRAISHIKNDCTEAIGLPLCQNDEHLFDDDDIVSDKFVNDKLRYLIIFWR